MQLTRDVYASTARFPKTEAFGMTSQIRRSAVSVPSNIAEGHGRLTDRGFKVFLANARGSLFELETQLQLAEDFKYIDATAARDLLEKCDEVARMLNGLLSVLKTE